MRALSGSLLLLLFAVSSVAQAADYHVAVNGSDTSGDGSSGKPWATIGHAAAQVAAGDRVHVAPGSYAESVVTTASGSAGARISYVSDSRFGAKIDASGNYTGWQNSGDYVDIVGFDVSGSDYLGILNLGSYVRVVGNHVHHLATPSCNSGNGGAGIDHGDYAKHDNDTIGNIVDHVGDALTGCNQIQGIYHSNLRGHIWNNIVGQIAAYCIHNWHASSDVVIANNLVFACKSGGIIVGDGDSPGGVTADNFVVSNNIVLDSNSGIREYGSFGANNTYLDNLVFGCATPLELTNPDQGTLFVDPMLVAYKPDATGDYHLLPGSPCIDQGTAKGAPPDDFDGLTRPEGASVDIGPYEWAPPGADAGPDASGGAGGTGGASFDAATDGPSKGDASADAEPQTDGGAGKSGVASSSDDSGCSCRAGGEPRSPLAACFAAFVAVWLLRRRA